MSSKDYDIYYKTPLKTDEDWAAWRWDAFISCYNSSERVRRVYENAHSENKFWLVHSEYEYSNDELPDGFCIRLSNDEAASIINSVSQIEAACKSEIASLRLCVDLTGFMRPHLLFLALYLSRKGVKRFDVLYTEPEGYKAKENTTFSQGALTIRQIAGFEGINSPDNSNDLLVIGSGYDHRLIAAVSEYKDKADKIQIFGLPSLRADMYQENVLGANKAKDAIGTNKTTTLERAFAPASDPFVTATVLSEIVERRKRIAPISNLYLSPLATKPQALGFALYYIGEGANSNCSVLFPISKQYARETSYGLSRVWLYRVEFPIFE